MAFLPTNASQVQQFAVGLYGIQVGTATMAAVQQDITAVGGLNNALNAYYAASFGSSTTASVGTTVAANLGLTGQAATDAAAYITAVLNSTAANSRGAAIEGVLSLFSTLTSNATFGAAATAWNTKVAAAVAYTGAADVASGSGVATGTIYTLTTSADSIPGTAGDDTINGNVSAVATILTATSGDVIDGGAGKDTLNLTVIDAANPGLLNVANVETVNVRALAAATGIDTLLFAGTTAFNSNGSQAAVTVNNAALATTYGLSNTVSGQQADLTINFRGTDVAGTTDQATVSVSAVGSSVLAAAATVPTITTPVVTLGTGIESVSLTAAGTNYVKVSAPATATKLSVAGAGVNTITVDGFASTVTVDASASTGTNTFVLGSGLTTGDVITGGAGADTVRAVTTGTQSNVTLNGVETFRFDATSTGTVAFASNPGLTTIDDRSSSAVAVTGVTTLSNLNLRGDSSLTFNGNFGGVTLNTAFAGTADALAISVGNNGNTTSAGFSTGDIKASGIEGLAITQADMLSSQTTTVGTISDTGLKTLAVTTPGAFAITALSTKASSAPGFTGTASTTGSNTVTSIDLSGVAAGSGTITFEDGTFAAAATVKAAGQGGTYNFGSESATDVITFTGASTAGADIVNVNAVSGGTTASGTYAVTFSNASNNTFDGSKLAVASTGNTVNVTDGAGNGTLTGGANADYINGGAGADVITGARGADVLIGGTGADTYNMALGRSVTPATEVQTITPTAGGSTSTVSHAAGTVVFVVGGKTVPVYLPADTTIANASIAISNALNAASAGAFTASYSSTAVTITYPAASGNVAPIQAKLGVDGTLTSVGTAANATGSVSLVDSTTTATIFTVATGTQGALLADGVSSDSAALSLTLDQVSYVSTDGDKFHITDYAGTAVSASLGNAVTATTTKPAINAAGLVTGWNTTAAPTSLSGAVTQVAAGVDTGAAGLSVAFVYGGQAYLYVTDGTAGVLDTDLLVTLTGVTTLATGITLSGNDISAIA